MNNYECFADIGSYYLLLQDVKATIAKIQSQEITTSSVPWLSIEEELIQLKKEQKRYEGLLSQGITCGHDHYIYLQNTGRI